jgi:hypothetical protein
MIGWDAGNLKRYHADRRLGVLIVRAAGKCLEIEAGLETVGAPMRRAYVSLAMLNSDIYLIANARRRGGLGFAGDRPNAYTLSVSLSDLLLCVIYYLLECARGAARHGSDRRDSPGRRVMLRLNTGSFSFSPTRPVPLAGFGRRTAPYEEIRDDLEAVFLRLSDDNGGEVVLGSIDTLYLTDRSLSDIEEAVGGERTPLCLFATHTHYAPSLAPDLPLPHLGVHDYDWYHSVVSRCARTIESLAEWPGEGVTLRYGERATDLNVNRRRRAWIFDYPALVRHGRVSAGWQVAIAPNKRGCVDRRVKALLLENSSGDVRAVIWTFAAHPSRSPAQLAVSAAFPGLIRTALRRRFGADCAVVYLPGLTGSVIPKIPLRWPRTPSEAATRLLPFYPDYRSFGENGYRKWAAKLFSEFLRAYDARGLEAPENGISVRRTSVPGIFRARNGTAQPSDPELRLLRVTLARGLHILAGSGEMLAEWMPLLQPAACGDTVLLSGYLAGPALYVPTSAELQDGGYEVKGFQRDFGLDGEFLPDISRLVVSAAKRLFDPVMA